MSLQTKDMKIDVLMNCILVENDVRPAFLIQTIDYGEFKTSDPETASILASIRKWFPKLNCFV